MGPRAICPVRLALFHNTKAKLKGKSGLDFTCLLARAHARSFCAGLDWDWDKAGQGHPFHVPARVSLLGVFDEETTNLASPIQRDLC